jgi:hypothetical protein
MSYFLFLVLALLLTVALFPSVFSHAGDRTDSGVGCLLCAGKQPARRFERRSGATSLPSDLTGLPEMQRAWMARKSLANVASVDVLGSLQEDLAVTASFAVHRSA